MLVSMDGTLNKNLPDDTGDTNARKFFEAYRGADKVYIAGIGADEPWYKKWLGAAFGVGGRDKAEEAVEGVETFRSLSSGNLSKPIDIVGFSRGAATALHVANALDHRGVPIRFMGLWDTVPSFGLPGKVNLGWELTLPDNVEVCYHALALDEHRSAFQLCRLNARVKTRSQKGRAHEVWFRGVHSDVGGGNHNEALSSISLHWMFEMAQQVNPDMIYPIHAEQNEPKREPLAPIRKHKWDLIENFRTVRWNDRVHWSVEPRSGHNNPPL